MNGTPETYTSFRDSPEFSALQDRANQDIKKHKIDREELVHTYLKSNPLLFFKKEQGLDDNLNINFLKPITQQEPKKIDPTIEKGSSIWSRLRAASSPNTVVKTVSRDDNSESTRSRSSTPSFSSEELSNNDDCIWIELQDMSHIDKS